MRTKAEKSAYDKSWRLANVEKNKAIQQKWYQENKEKKLASNKAWHLLNKEKRSSQKREYDLQNKDKQAARSAKRRLLKQNSEAAMTEAEKKNYQELILIRDEATKLFGYEWSIDHIIPLSKGGTNAINNLEVVPLSWNKSKGNRSTESYWGTAA